MAISNTEYSKILYHTRKSTGLCTRCGCERGLDATPTKCRKCADNRNNKYIYHSRLILNGTCVSCWTKPALDTCTRCQQCNDKRHRSRKEERQHKIKNGICIRCKDPAVDRLQFCEKHYFYTKSLYLFNTTRYSDRLKDLLISQQYKCHYSGIPLKIGVNATIDHVIPVSRAPHLSKDINNMIWCDWRINEVKNSMTPEELYALCRLILDNAPKNRIG